MPQTSPTAGSADGSAHGHRALGDDLRGFAAPGDDLARLAARLRAAAATVEVQAAVHRGLLLLDWHGPAATAFDGLVLVRAAALGRLADELLALADSASRRAVTGDALRAVAGWAS